MKRRAGRSMGANALKLGVFAANCSGGLAATCVPERWGARWLENLAVGKLADDRGLEFVLPLARYAAYGGQSNFQGSVLDSIVWASALLAATRRVSCFATVHTAFVHPMLAAKQFATADQVGQGRFGVNMVAGWNEPEYRMFGLNLPLDHQERYAYAQEWWDIICRSWQANEPFTWTGKYFQLENVYSRPVPFNGSFPTTLNAASSSPGREFAIRNADYLFTVLENVQDGAARVAALKSSCAASQRAVGVFTSCHVVCRATDAEADGYYEYYAVENADTDAVKQLRRLLGATNKSFSSEALAKFDKRFAGGHGSYPLVGSPDTVTQELARIAHSGFDGVALSFVDFEKELPFFCDEVVPRLEKLNLRVPHSEEEG